MSISVSAKTFRALRAASGLSIDCLALTSGVSRSTILRIERAEGDYRANSVQAQRLAKAFGIDVSSLKNGAVDEVIVAEGDFVPIRLEFVSSLIVDGRLQLRHEGTNLKDPDPNFHILTMVGTVPGTMIIRAVER